MENNELNKGKVLKMSLEEALQKIEGYNDPDFSIDKWLTPWMLGVKKIKNNVPFY